MSVKQVYRLASGIWTSSNGGSYIPPFLSPTGRVSRVRALSTSAPIIPPVTYTRPTGTGYYAIEDLGVGLDLRAAFAAVGAQSGTIPGVGGKALTLPIGVFVVDGFSQSSDYLGVLTPTNVGLIGSGPNTVIQVNPNSITAHQAATWVPPPTPLGTTNQLNVILFPSATVPITIAQFRVQGTSQRVGGTGTNYTYNGLRTNNCVGPVLTDLWVKGIPGFLNSPPGETFGINIYRGSGAILTRVETDGRDLDGSIQGIAGAKIGAAGIGLNTTSNTSLTDCWTHHTGFSHGLAIYQSPDTTTTRHRAEYCGTGNGSGATGGTVGVGLNCEQSNRSIHHSPTLGFNTLAQMRYYGTTSGSFAGDTTGHTIDGLVLSDGGSLTIRIDNAQTSHPTLTTSPTPTYL